METNDLLTLIGGIAASGTTGWLVIRRFVVLDGLDARVAKLESWKENRNQELETLLTSKGYANRQLVEAEVRTLQAGQTRMEEKLDLLLEHVLSNRYGRPKP